MRQGFILGIGTNVDPERNARHIVERLVDRFGRTLVSRLHYTEPVGMDKRPAIHQLLRLHRDKA